MPTEDEVVRDEHRARAAEMLSRLESGEPKNSLERDYFGSDSSHGKRVSTYIARHLGVETETRSAQSRRIDRLEALLRAAGIAPDEQGLSELERLLAKSRESALAAIRVYNDPTAGFRTESFLLLMAIAWNTLFLALAERDGIDTVAREADGSAQLIDGRERRKETWELACITIANRTNVLANLDFLLGLRNAVAHQYLPAIDMLVLGEVQSMLINYETILSTEFGEEWVLGDRLTVPLQISNFRPDASLSSLRSLMAQIPSEVREYIEGKRNSLSSEVRDSPEFALRLYFVAISANHEKGADAVVTFIKPDQVTDELVAALPDLTVVTKPRTVRVASAGLHRPGRVVELVQKRLDRRFTIDLHTRAWRYFKVRPRWGVPRPEITDDRYCIWASLSREYGYTDAWVDFLVQKLSDDATYELVVQFTE